MPGTRGGSVARRYLRRTRIGVGEPSIDDKQGLTRAARSLYLLILIMNIKFDSAATGLFVTLSTAGGAALPVPAWADRRAYGETYEAVTAARGELDVESWTTFASGSDVPEGPSATGYRTMLELEYGITDRWDVAVYNMLDFGVQYTTPSGVLTAAPGYAGFKIETRYRLSLPGEWVVDPVLYLEYARGLLGDASDSLELKGIVAKDVGPWNVALNTSVEVERLLNGVLNPELEYAAGVSREIGTPAFKLGLEAFGKFERPSGQMEAYAWAGPCLSWAMTFERGMRGIWVTIAAGRGLTPESPSFYGRGILGLQF